MESALPDLGPRAIGIVIKKEFLDNVRNRWILALSGTFVALTLLVSYFGATQTGGGAGLQGFTETVVGMVSIVVILVPILGLMVSYGAVVGEKEGGSLQLLLSMPITRRQVLLGKFLGLGAVITTAVLSGLGLAGLVILVSVGTEGWESFLLFLGGTILFALVFVSLGTLLSTGAKRRSLAVGLAVLLWFVIALIYELVVSGIYVALGGTLIFLPGQGPLTFPDWFFVAGMVNPAQAYGYFASRVFDFTAGFGFEYVVPDFVNIATTTASMVAWIVVPFLVAMILFQRQDL